MRVNFLMVSLSIAADLQKGRNTFEERIGWLPFPLKYSIAFASVSIYSTAFLLSGIATCTDKPLVKRNLYESLEGSFTLFGKI
jgi:hypothetical protein